MYMRVFMTVVLLVMGGSVFHQLSPPQPLRTIYERDVDGDGKADKLVYEIAKLKDNYEGSLVITSGTRRTLWEHRWGMRNDDLSELIETDGDVTNKKIDLESWVMKFFVGELNYGAKFEKRKLKASELRDEDRLAAFAKYHGVSLASLKKSILSQKVNSLLTYRAEWREDLNLLVYVPSIGKFVCYQRGY